MEIHTRLWPSVLWRTTRRWLLLNPVRSEATLQPFVMVAIYKYSRSKFNHRSIDCKSHDVKCAVAVGGVERKIGSMQFPIKRNGRATANNISVTMVQSMQKRDDRFPFLFLQLKRGLDTRKFRVGSPSLSPGI